MHFFSFLSSASSSFAVFPQVGAGRRVFELMDRNPNMPPSGDLTPVGSPDGAALDFQSVYFSYPSRPSSWVLEDFTLTINPGQTVALVGSSGGGKSTVVRLVQRFYDPQRGSVIFDGVDLKQIDRMHLHRQVALVAQEPLIFAESIRYNITFGVQTKDVTEVSGRHCLRCSCGFNLQLMSLKVWSGTNLV